MSKDVAITRRSKAGESSNLPVLSAAERLATELATISKRVSAPTGDRIRLNGNKTFIAPDGTEGDHLEVVILDFMSTNLYYDRPYDSSNPSPPACFAIGPEPGSMVPSENSPNKQADSCSSCPQNQFNSALVGKGKACKNTRLVAMVPSTCDENTPIMIMSIPPTSLKSFDGYVSSLAMKHRTVPVGAVTKITLDPNSTYAAPRFEIVRKLEDEELELCMARRDEAIQRLTTEPDVSAYEEPKQRGKGAVRR